MAKIMKRLQELLDGFFADQPDDLRKPLEPDELDIEDTAVVAMDIFDEHGRLKSHEQEKSDDKGYWWCFEGSEPSDMPVVEGLNPDEIVQELEVKISKDEFPIIEIPSHVMKTLQILNSPDFDYAEVSSLVSHSPGMAGEFIRVINSPLYNRGIAISDLKAALPRLGRDNIKAMLYMYSSKMSFAKDPLFNELAAEIVEHSYAVGLIASYLSQRYYPDPDGAFLAGLLHDIGKLGILKAVSEGYSLPREELQGKVSEEIFDEIFQKLHERAGSFLAKNWKIDRTVILSIEHHHDFMECGFEESEQLALHLSCLINLSDSMARILGHGRGIGAMNIFSEPSTIDLSMEKTPDTLKFLDEIPGIVTFKTGSPEAADTASQNK